MSSPPAVPATALPDDDLLPVHRVLRAAWYGVLLGLVIELLVLVVQSWQAQMPDAMRIAADTMQKMSWSALVCAALAAGQVAARTHAGLAVLFGLIGAPVAFLLARALHKAVLSALGADVGSAAIQWLGAGVKAVEYALLGLVIMWLAERKARWNSYVFYGAGIGAITYVLTSFWLPTPGHPLQRAVTEILHPIGCTLAVFLTLQLNRHLKTSASSGD